MGVFQTSFLIVMSLWAGHVTAQAKVQKIRVGSSPVVSSAGIYLALERGFFKEQGLQVEVTDIPASGAPMTVLLATGELDVGAGNLSAGLFNAILKGMDFKLVADKGHLAKGREYIRLMVRSDHLKSGRYKTLKDLKGFRMGLTALDGVSQTVLLDRFLKKAKLALQDVKLIKMSYAEMNTALRTKNLDATIQLEPFVASAEMDGVAQSVASGVEVHPRQQSAAIFYSQKFMKERRGDAVRFMRAYIKGVRLYNRSLQDQEVGASVYTDLNKHVKMNINVWSKMQPIGLRDDGLLEVSALNEDLQWYEAAKFLRGKLAAEDIVDHSFVHEAVKNLNAK